MHIEIKDNTVEVKRGNARATGKPYEMQEQTGFLVTAEERRKIVITLRPGQQPYAAGRYLLGDDSFEVDRYGALGIGRLNLTPHTVQAARAG